MTDVVKLIYTKISYILLYMNTTIEITELRAMTVVAAEGSFTAAAAKLGTDKAHISRIISRLEEKLGARLLERSTRRLHVTELGREVNQRAIGILQALENTVNTVAKAQGTPTGSLKITAGPEFGTLVVRRWIAEYLKLYSEVSVEAEFTNRITDVIHEGFDVSIRVGQLPDSDLSARKIGQMTYGLYASPAYLEEKGRPQSPEDLHTHKLIGFSPRGKPTWSLNKDKEKVTLSPSFRYLTNNNQTAMGATIDGLGIALLPCFMAETEARNSTLEVILPEWKRAPVPIHAVFASNRYMAPKVRAFVDIAVQYYNSE